VFVDNRLSDVSSSLWSTSSSFSLSVQPGGEAGPIGFPGHAYQRVAVLAADFAVLVAMPGDVGCFGHWQFAARANFGSPV
jgi:hypothetical protein